MAIEVFDHAEAFDVTPNGVEGRFVGGKEYDACQNVVWLF